MKGHINFGEILAISLLNLMCTLLADRLTSPHVIVKAIHTDRMKGIARSNSVQLLHNRLFVRRRICFYTFKLFVGIRSSHTHHTFTILFYCHPPLWMIGRMLVHSTFKKGIFFLNVFGETKTTHRLRHVPPRDKQI